LTGKRPLPVRRKAASAGVEKSPRPRPGGLSQSRRLSMKPEASQDVSSGILRPIAPGSAREAAVNRYAVLYLATLFVLIPLDFLFLGIVAKGFFTS